MGAIVWTCLALAVHQGPVKEQYFKSRELRFPINVREQKNRDAIKKYILLVSEDEGKNWQQADSRDPSEKELVYRATHDGRHWFILQVLTQAGTTPSNPARVQPNMIINIDRVAPQIQVTADRLPSGQVRARWKIAEPYPDTRSIVLEYHTRAVREGQWVPLGILPALEGQHEFDPGREGQTGELSIRVRMKDQAGNLGQGMVVVPASATGPEIPAAVGSPPKQPDNSAISLIPSGTPNPSISPSRLTSQQTTRPPVDPTPLPLPGAGTTLKPSLSSPDMGRPSGLPPMGGIPVASSTDRASPPPPPPNPVRETPANNPAVKVVKTREVRLDFTVAKVGPSGLGNADVYVTLDKGANWKKLPGDSPITLPPNVDVRRPDPISGSVGVQLPAEGTVYGFLVAVKSKAGLAPPPPNPGDAPEILVELDTTAPRAQMYKPMADPSQPNTLLLSWVVTDRNLSETPIVLEWSEQANGPWTAIGGGPLPNNSQYSWHLPAQVPSSVYLRLTARDLAGNEGRAQTDKPQLIDLSIPQTKITGLAPGR